MIDDANRNRTAIPRGAVRWSGGHPNGVTGRLRLAPPDRADGGEIGDALDAVAANIETWLDDHSEELHVPRSRQLPCVSCVDIGNDTTVVRFSSSIDGVPIWGGEHVVVVEGEAITSLKIDDAIRLPSELADSAGPAISATEARQLAEEAVGDSTSRIPRLLPELVMLRRGDRLQLSYRVLLATTQPADWEVFVNADSGEVIAADDLIADVDGSGAVFDPNPVVSSNDASLRAPDAPAACGFVPTDVSIVDAERVSRPLRDLRVVGGKATLDGPYCRIVNLAAPDHLPPAQSTPYAFDYSSEDPAFDAVNVYFHIDSIQRFMRDQLGILTAHPEPIDADVADGTKRGAFYSTLDKSLHFGDSGDCGPNRAADADVIAHEYGHAIQTTQVPNWGITSPITGRRETRAMGEGFGDLLACLIYAERGGGYQREVFEDWAYSQSGGLRRVDGSRRYPDDWVTGLGEHHENGQIWSGALWQIYLRLGGSGATPSERERAASEVLGSLILSHHRLAASATMSDGAEALLAQNCSMRQHRGVSARAMLEVFHDRGLLPCEAGSDLRIVEVWSQHDDASERSWETVEADQDNFFYARVRNDGAVTARAGTVSFAYASPFGTPTYPQSFRDQIVASAVVFDVMPGAEVVVAARWPAELIPPIPTGSTRRHGCILAEVFSPCDAVGPSIRSTSRSNGKLRQRNTDIVNVVPGQTLDYSIQLDSVGFVEPTELRFEAQRDARFPNLVIELRHHDRAELERLVRGSTAAEGKTEQRTPGGLYLLDPVRLWVEPQQPGGPPVILQLAAGSELIRGTAALLAGEAGSPGGGGGHRAATSGAGGLGVVNDDGAGVTVRLAAGELVGFTHVTRHGETGAVGLRLQVPGAARVGDEITTVVRQIATSGELFGAFDLIMRVVAGELEEI